MTITLMHDHHLLIGPETAYGTSQAAGAREITVMHGLGLGSGWSIAWLCAMAEISTPALRSMSA